MKVVLDDSPVKPWRPASKVPRALLEAAFMVLLPRLRNGLRFRHASAEDYPVRAKGNLFSTFPHEIRISQESLQTESTAMLAGRIAEAIESLAAGLNALEGDGEVVTVDLEKPKGVDFADIRECVGISLRVVRAYNMKIDAMDIRFDVLCAVVPAVALVPE